VVFTEVSFVPYSFCAVSEGYAFFSRHRSFPWGIAHLFLLINVIVGHVPNWIRMCERRAYNGLADVQTMLAGSGAVITKKYTEFAIGGLLGVVIVQGFGYGLIFDLNFFLRNLSVIGGLFMVFSDSMITRRTPFAGLPNISENDRKK